MTVHFTFSGTATAGADYSNASPGNVFLAAGESEASVVISVVDDLHSEEAETIVLQLTSATNGYTLSGSPATIAIQDNEVVRINLVNTYAQHFNTLSATGTSNFLPGGWLFSETGTSANQLYAAGTGSSNAGDTYSFGTTESDRALGAVQSGSLVSTIGAIFQNNSGSTIHSLLIEYTGEQWRLGTAGRTDQLNFQLSTDATELTNGTWSTIPFLSFQTPNTLTVGAKDGNAPANQAAINYTLTGLNIAAGSTFMIRWVDVNASGADDGLAVDDFSIEVNPRDTEQPALLSFSPANGASAVPMNTTLSLTFSEPIVQGTGAVFIRNTADGSLFRQIASNDPSVRIDGSNLSIPLQGLRANNTYAIEMENGFVSDIAGNNFAGIQPGAWSITTGNALFAADFSVCGSTLPSGFVQYSVVGSQVWACTNFGRDSNNLPSGSAPSGLQINGFDRTNIPNEDWLISPAFDLTETTYPLLSFWSRTAFNGLPLQLKVSTDYTGGNPAAATWVDVNGKFPGQATDAWTLSSGINLSAFKQANVHFAFVYSSSEEEGARWTLDDILLQNSSTPPPPAITISSADINFQFVRNGTTDVRAFTFIANDLVEPVTVNATGHFLLSKDSLHFSSGLTFSVEEANNISSKVFVQFNPSASNEDFAGLIVVTTSAIADSLNVTGTSIDPSTTLEVVNWNVEWFGSVANGPTNEIQQQENVKKIMQSMKADVYAFVEIVSEEKLAALVSQLPGYSYVISNYGSHTNTSANPPSAINEAQKLVFIYRNDVLSNVSAAPLLSAGINSPQDLLNPAYNYWASGRFPFMLTADVTLNCETKQVRFVLAHAKANTSPTAVSYERRKNGADTLYQLLNALYPDDNIIVLGDINDDLDQSITAGFTTTSWDAFTTDTVNYAALTLPLSLAGKKSTVSYNDVIDHVIVSSEMEQYYLPSTAGILTDVANLVSNYGSTTSDHYPVMTRFQFGNVSAPVITFCPPTDTLCENPVKTYEVPALVADACSVLEYQYSVSGATQRTGNGANASGHFETGLNTITWTVTDINGRSSTCQTQLLIRNKPTVDVVAAPALPQGVLPNTVYVGYEPASGLTLQATANGDTAGYRFEWSSSQTGASVFVSPETKTTYTVSVTDSFGCVNVGSVAIEVIDVRAGNNNDKVLICKQSSGTTNTLQVARQAVPAHLANGVMLGSCGVNEIIGGRELLNTERAEVVVYPNPSATAFRISVKGNSRISYTVTDVSGSVVERKENVVAGEVLRIGSGYKKGIYFVNIMNEGEVKVVKLVKL